MKITGRMLEKYGHTDECEGNRNKKAGFQEARPHSESCRARIIEAMQGDGEGEEWLRKVTERMNHKLAAEIEKQDRKGEEEVVHSE